MHDAVAHKLGVFQPRHEAEHALLLAPLHARLARHKAVERALAVFGAQLQHSIRTLARARVGESNRLERTKAQGVLAARG